MTSLGPITATLHEPRHAAAFDFHRNAAAITRAKGYQPKHARTSDPRCPRCTAVGASGLLCPPCAGEVATNRSEARDELLEFIRTDDGTDSGRTPPQWGPAA